MNKIIFSKYSNERANRFCIRTDICQDAKGKKWVEKRPMSQESELHIKSIFSHEESLKKLLQDTKLQVNYCEKTSQGIRLEYLEGKTLEQVLDEWLEKKEEKRLFQEIEEFFKYVLGKIPTVPFVETSGFLEVFGKVSGLEGMEAYSVSDIDMIFSNVIVGKEGGLTLIDYEWTFDFPIPVKFIMYRCLQYYFLSNQKRFAKIGGICHERFGITESEAKIFEEMEISFQNYMLGERTPIRNLYDAVSPGCISMKPVLDGIYADSSKRRAQIFFDTGYGFREEDSSYYEAGAELVKLRIPILKGTKKLRFDPSSSACALYIKSFKIAGEEPVFETNGIKTGEGMFLFDTEDPQIIVSDILEEAKELEIEFQVAFIEGLPLHAVASMMNQLKITKERVCQMEETKIWKLNKKLRKIIGRK